MSRTRPASPLSPWIDYAQPFPDSRAVLLCCHYAGGAASAFRPWISHLAGLGIEVWPVQLPGREGRYNEPFEDDLDLVADEITACLSSSLAGRPYAIYGHSAGAYLATVVAAGAGARPIGEPVHLVLGACRPPAHPDPDFPIHRLPREQLLDRLFGYGRLPEEILDHPELLELALTTARSDLRLVETYPWPQVPMLSCPVTAICGTSDTTVPVASQQGWSRITSGPFTAVTVAGGHFPPPPSEAQILEVIRRALH